MPAWRDFEKFVAQIEKALAPLGAKAKSPDRIRDLVTNQPREVDASIRYQIGTVPVLITIECRKRQDKEDQTWIEQLVTKKESLGAAKTIAVSSTGISGPAMDLARRKSIEVRQVNEVTEDEIQKWLGLALEMRVVKCEWKLTGASCEFEVNPATPLADFERGKHAILNGENAADYPFMRGPNRCSLPDLFKEFEKAGCLSNWTSLYDWRPQKWMLTGEYPRGHVILPKENVIFHVRKIDFYFDIMAAIVPSEKTMVWGEYRTGEKPLYQAAAHSIIFEKQQYSFTIHKDLKNDQIKSTFIHHNLKTGEIELLAEKDGIPTKPPEGGAAYLD